MPTPAAPTRRLLSDLRALPKPFWILFTGTFINRLGTFVWPFLTIYLTQRGHSPLHAAWAVSCFGVGSLLGSSAGGWLTDRFGRRHTIALGSAASASFVLALYAVQSLPAVMLCTILIGVAGGTYHPAASALLVDVVPEPLRVCAYAAYRVALNAGFACGAALGGLLADRSFGWLFLGDAATTYLYSLVALSLLPHGLRGQTSEAPWAVAWRRLARDRVLHAVLLSIFGGTLIFAQFGTTYSLQVTRLRLTVDLLGWTLAPKAVYGLLIGWNGLMVMLFELPLTRWTQAWRPRQAMALGFLLLGVGFGLNAFASSVSAFFGAMTLFTLGEMIGTPVTHAFAASLAPAAMRGRYMGALEFPHSLGVILGPVLGSLLFQQGPALLWAACAALGASSGAVVLWYGRPPAGVPSGSGLSRLQPGTPETPPAPVQ